MNTTDVLVLNGSPGSGKSTLADAISELLRESDQAHAVIDVDELARLYPESDGEFKWNNLASVWPNYAAKANLKVILPVLIDSQKDLQALRRAAPARSFSICELTAPEETLKKRVTQREPNEFWQSKLSKLVDGYLARSDAQKFRDFQVDTHVKSIEESAIQIATKIGWS